MWGVKQREGGLTESALRLNAQKRESGGDPDRWLAKYITGETQQEAAAHTRLQQTHPAHTQTEAVKHTAGCLRFAAETSSETKREGGVS